MARTTAAASSDAEGAQPKGGRSRLLLIVAVVAVLGVAGAGFAVFGGGDAAAAEETEVPVEGAVVDVAEMTVNLVGPTTGYARIAFAAVLAEGADESAVAARFALLKDAAITELGMFDAGTLRTSAGVEQLRERLSLRATEVYADGEVLRVVLTELVVQ